MRNANRGQIKRILNKGSLTGLETAKIAMYQIYELCKIAEPELFDSERIDLDNKYRDALVLSIEEIDILKEKNLRGRNDKIDEFNNWNGAMGSFLYLVLSSHILYLQIVNLISDAKLLAEIYLVDENDLKNFNESPRITLAAMYLELKHKIALFEGRRSITKILSEVTDINFSEKPDKWNEDIKHELRLYESAMEKVIVSSDVAKKELSRIPVGIEIDGLGLNQEVEDKIRRRLLQPLEKDKWMYECLTFLDRELMRMAENGVFSIRI